MVRGLKILGLVLLSSGTLIAGPTTPAFTATSATLDILPDQAADPIPDTVQIGTLKPIGRPALAAAANPMPSGNPLWAVPLSTLTATRERPIFSASRRPMQRAVAATPVEQVNAPVVRAEPERLLLTLIGAVVGDTDAIAVFLDRANQKVVRLRQGESHAGWTLSEVRQREVRLKKLDRTEVLALQRSDGAATPAAAGPTLPAGGINTSYAPFTPHSTPRNGESDGL
jgi:general secretion pathway protein N